MTGRRRERVVPAAIFDVDGVLLDSEPVYFRVQQEMLRERGHDIGWEEYTGTLGLTVLQAWERLAATRGLAGDPARLAAEEDARAIEAFAAGVEPVPGVRAFLEDLAGAGWALAVASSGSRDVIDAKLRGLGLEEAFGTLASGDEVTRGKPAPDLARLALSRLGVPPQHAVVLEDTSFGLRAARAAGCVPVWISGVAVKPVRRRWWDARWEDFRGRTAGDLVALLHGTATPG